MQRIGVLLSSGLTFLVCASFQQPTIRVEVEAVNVLVTVTDQKGRLVTDLAPDRFRVDEDRVQQPISNFSHQSDLPLSLALLMDTSSSIRLQLDFEKKAATQFLYEVMEPQDRALLVEFDSGVSVIHDFTNRPGNIAREIRQLRSGGGTALLDAIYAVCEQKLTGSIQRKAIILVSDGLDRNSRHTLEQALQMVHKVGAIIYTVGTTRFAADVPKKGERVLKTLAEETGGRALFPYSEGKLSQAFEQINKELRSQYSLTYVPINKSRDGKYRRIRVRVLDSKNLKIRYRKGYYAPSA